MFLYMETFYYLCMREKFEIKFLEPAEWFLEEIGLKAKNKLLFNIKRAKDANDPSIFKKLDSDLWEFRARANGMQYRLLAFWDKRSSEKTLVVCCHGFIKKTDKVPISELNKTRKLMINYLLE